MATWVCSRGPLLRLRDLGMQQGPLLRFRDGAVDIAAPWRKEMACGTRLSSKGEAASRRGGMARRHPYLAWSSPSSSCTTRRTGSTISDKGNQKGAALSRVPMWDLAGRACESGRHPEARRVTSAILGQFSTLLPAAAPLILSESARPRRRRIRHNSDNQWKTGREGYACQTDCQPNNPKQSCGIACLRRP